MGVFILTQFSVGDGLMRQPVAMAGMQIEFVCYGTVRDAVGQKALQRDLPDGTTVGEAVSSLGEEFTDLGPLVFDSAGNLRANVNVLHNEENVRTLDGQTTELTDGDTVGIAPSLAGGSGTGQTTARHPIGGDCS